MKATPSLYCEITEFVSRERVKSEAGPSSGRCPHVLPGGDALKSERCQGAALKVFKLTAEFVCYCGPKLADTRQACDQNNRTDDRGRTPSPPSLV